MTTPVVVTSLPAIGEVEPVPWISAMLFSTGPGGGGGAHASPQASGLGLPVAKSSELSGVFWVPLRDTEAVLEGAGVGPLPA